MNEKLYFDEVKILRGKYYAIYKPPSGGMAFANLTLIYPSTYDPKEVGENILEEAKFWLNKYPVEIFANAYDAAEENIYPHGEGTESSLWGWRDPVSGAAKFTWKIDELPKELRYSRSHNLRNIYADIPFRTDAQVKADARQSAQAQGRNFLKIKLILVFWVSIIPLTWASIQYFGPEWLGTAVYFYAFWQAWQALRKLMGSKKLSKREAVKAEEQRKKDHYFYHCEKNPDGFAKLLVENFERDARERTRKEMSEFRDTKNG
jgi:hypothetical protein